MKYANHWRYLCLVREKLLGSGIAGIKIHDLNQMTRTKIFNQNDLREALEAWELREWVQSFVVPGGRGRRPTVWRATTKLRDEWRTIDPEAEELDPVEPAAIHLEGLA